MSKNIVKLDNSEGTKPLHFVPYRQNFPVTVEAGSILEFKSNDAATLLYYIKSVGKDRASIQNEFDPEPGPGGLTEFYDGQTITGIQFDTSKENELTEWLHGLSAFESSDSITLVCRSAPHAGLVLGITKADLGGGAVAYIVACGVNGDSPVFVFSDVAIPEYGIVQGFQNLTDGKLIADDTYTVGTDGEDPGVNTDVTGWNGIFFGAIEGEPGPTTPLTPFAVSDSFTQIQLNNTWTDTQIEDYIGEGGGTSTPVYGFDASIGGNTIYMVIFDKINQEGEEAKIWVFNGTEQGQLVWSASGGWEDDFSNTYLSWDKDTKIISSNAGPLTVASFREQDGKDGNGYIYGKVEPSGGLTEITDGMSVSGVEILYNVVPTGFSTLGDYLDSLQVPGEAGSKTMPFVTVQGDSVISATDNFDAGHPFGSVCLLVFTPVGLALYANDEINTQDWPHMNANTWYKCLDMQNWYEMDDDLSIVFGGATYEVGVSNAEAFSAINGVIVGAIQSAPPTPAQDMDPFEDGELINQVLFTSDMTDEQIDALIKENIEKLEDSQNALVASYGGNSIYIIQFMRGTWESKDLTLINCYGANGWQCVWSSDAFEGDGYHTKGWQANWSGSGFSWDQSTKIYLAPVSVTVTEVLEYANGVIFGHVVN